MLEAFGSITDPKEFDQKVLKKILKIAIDSARFDTIIIETHVTKISEELVTFIESINNGKKAISFEIGVEDMDTENRKMINKLGVENNKIQEVYEMLLEHNMGLDINLIYGFPFMNEGERICAVIKSLKKIKNNLPKAGTTLFLMSVKENTILEYMQKNGWYKLPNQWGLVEMTRMILYDDELRDLEPPSFSWFGEKESLLVSEQTCYTCQNCKKKIIETFRKINGTFNNEERKKFLKELFESIDDECYQEFLETLKNEKDGKTPKDRYKAFLQEISEKGINKNNSKIYKDEKYK